MPVDVQSPPELPHDREQPAMGAAETETMPVVDSVVRAIQTLTTDANYKLVSDVFTEVMFLKDQNRSLKTSKRELLEEYRSFRNELEEEEAKLKYERDVLEKRIEEKERQISELHNANTQLTEAKDLLESQLQEKDQSLTALGEAKSGLESDKTSLEAKIADKDAELARLNEARSVLADEKAALESSVEAKTKELAILGEERGVLESLLAEKTKEVEQLTEEKTKLADEISTLETSAAEKDAVLDGLRLEKAALVEEKGALESQASQKEKDLDDLQGVKAKLENDLAELETSRAQLETELTGANAKIEEQAKQAEANANEVLALRVDVDKHMLELTGLKDDLSKVTTTAEDYKARGDSLETELADMSAKADEKAAHVGVLEGEVADLARNLEETRTRIEGLEGELGATTKIADERAASLQALEGQLNGVTTTADEARARVEFLETELCIVTSKAEQLQTNLSTTSEDLRDKNVRLAELDSYRVRLRSESEDTYVQILDTIWTSIAGLVETQFRQDLDHSVLSDESCWANLRQSEYLKHARQIPLPQSNSPAAKQMRVAAVLAVLSRSLHRYIFRPIYLAENHEGDECVVNMLRAIACNNATREEHTRATLLAMLPDRQKAAAAKRVFAVVREVSWSVQHLLSALQYEAFCTGLETACKLACVQWMRIQVAQMKIEPYFGPPYDNWDWQVLPLPAFEGSEEGVHLHGDGNDQDGGAVVDDADDVVVEIGRPVEDIPLTPRSGGRVFDQEDRMSHRSSPESATDYEGDPEVGPDEIMLVVWPSMCALENGELESITQGLVISKDQVRAALDEVRGRGRQRPLTKRARTLSMPGRGVSGSAVQSSLSHGDGDGSKDG
jgi:uncharacterized coiled-coil DUF342 family protein